MSDEMSHTSEDVLIGRDHWDVPVRVELRAYLVFGRRMDSQLRRLVARWTRTVSPPHFPTTDVRDSVEQAQRR
jgi:hypothetical protein